jgi:D-alanyl-D-alanine carboxypeptidase
LESTPPPASETSGRNGIKINARRPKTIAELTAATGQGDVEAPEDVKPAAKPQPSGQRMAMLVVPKSQREKAAKAPVAEARWSIQVGAYATKAATEAAIKQAIKKVPAILKNAKVVVAALPQKHGTVYRGRLSGLEASDARKACHLLTHCMTVPPGAS